MDDPSEVNPVLILGAGINGCAVARELVLNGIPVTIVDVADIATGATAKSSRLIHGGLRYLEYADFRLVAESLAERERQLSLAPQFVKPLRLHIPIKRRLGGLVQSAFRFLKLSRFSLGRRLAARLSPWSERGLYCVRMGLQMYDWISRSSRLPGHTIHRVSDARAPKIDPRAFRWVCSYSDAQMPYPERFVIALLKDAEQHASAHGIDFRVLPYHKVHLNGCRAMIRRLDRDGMPRAEPVAELQPSVIINATGAWGDLTLDQLGVQSQRLFGGTKGSHILTRHAGLRAAIGEDGVYAETSDGRLVFVLPFHQVTLIGTTDLWFDRPPDEAVATHEELQYLVDLVNTVFAGLNFSTGDVDAHYSGVRPLPFVPSGKTGSIPRGHFIHTSHHEGITLHTLIGGKLTTWRPFGEEVAEIVLQNLHRSRVTNTADRMLPGAENFPQDVDSWCRKVSAETGHSPEAARFVFELMGTSAQQLLHNCPSSDQPTLPGLPILPCVVETMIRNEWVNRLHDLIERRLGLVFGGELSRELLDTLADCLIKAGKLSASERGDEVAHVEGVLMTNYGIRLQ